MQDQDTLLARSAVGLDDAMAIGRLDAHDQAALVRRGEVSALELTEAAILRIEALEPKLNAVTWKAYDLGRARAAAQGPAGPMAGVPYLLKDSLDYPGMPTRSCSRLRAEAGPVSSEFDLTRAFDAAGLVPLGKTSMPEFALMATTEPVARGATGNPWDPARSPGGSSGGAGAVVAAGMVPLAQGGDGAGSIRIPAASCGVVGLKPSRGGNLRARAPHIVEDLLVGDSLLGRSVRDVDWAVRMARPEGFAALPPVEGRKPRIAVMVDSLYGRAPDPEVAVAIRRAAELCAGLGWTVEEVPLPIDGPAVMRSITTLWSYLGNDAVDHARSQAGGRDLEALLEPWSLGLAAHTNTLSPDDLEDAMGVMAGLWGQMAPFFQQWDAILSPVVRTPPPPTGEMAPTLPFERLLTEMFDYVSYTPLHNMTGMPALSLPLGWSRDGLPIGAMFGAARGGDDLLMQLAYRLEEVQPWADRWPAISAGA